MTERKGGIAAQLFTDEHRELKIRCAAREAQGARRAHAPLRAAILRLRRSWRGEALRAWPRRLEGFAGHAKRTVPSGTAARGGVCCARGAQGRRGRQL